MLRREKYKKYFEKEGLNFGRLISGSKTLYRKLNPESLVVFNARIYERKTFLRNRKNIRDFFKGQKYEIWYGDLDLSKDLYILYDIYEKIEVSIVITTEHGKKILEIGE